MDDKLRRVITITTPDTLTPTNTLTNAVVISYVLHVKIEGYKEVKLPLVIGTIPYVKRDDQQTPQTNGNGKYFARMRLV